MPRLVKGFGCRFEVKILGEGEERNFPLGEILPKANFICSPLTYTSKLTLTAHSLMAGSLQGKTHLYQRSFIA
jgi:hypothetical protein